MILYAILSHIDSLKKVKHKTLSFFTEYYLKSEVSVFVLYQNNYYALK